MTRLEAIAETMADFRDYDGWRMFIHRDIPGEHGALRDCWCVPHIVSSVEVFTPQQILDIVERAERLH